MINIGFDHLLLNCIKYSTELEEENMLSYHTHYQQLCTNFKEKGLFEM